MADKLLQRDSLLSMLRAYAYAGVISSGPWVLSIIGMLLIGILSFSVVKPNLLITQFQVTITNVIAFSLILTGPGQLAFTRFVADRLFEHRADVVAANYHGLLLLTTAVAGTLSLAVMLWFFPAQSLAYRCLTIATFVITCNIWMATVFLSGLKQYREIVILYLIGYGISVSAAYAMRPLGLEGLLAGYFVGQLFLFSGMHSLIIRNFLTPEGIRFDFLKKNLRYETLFWIGFLYNLSAWIDKFIFWTFPPTSEAIIGPCGRP
jgi:uncharacterized membrane protein